MRKKHYDVSNYWQNDVPTLSEREIGYLAGFIDGEGTISIYRTYRRYKGNVSFRAKPEISVSSTNLKVIELMKKYGFKHRTQKGNDRLPNRKTLYYISIRRFNAIDQLLTQIKDSLVVKKEQALIILEFIRMRREELAHFHRCNGPKTDWTKELALVEKIQHLNIRGTKGEVHNPNRFKRHAYANSSKFTNSFFG